MHKISSVRSIGTVCVEQCATVRNDKSVCSQKFKNKFARQNKSSVGPECNEIWPTRGDGWSQEMLAGLKKFLETVMYQVSSLGNAFSVNRLPHVKHNHILARGIMSCMQPKLAFYCIFFYTKPNPGI